MSFSPGTFRQLVACSAISVALLVCGTSLGWPSPVILAVQETGKPFNMTHDDVAIMVSAIYVGNMASPLPSGMLMDAMGRKNTLHVLSVVPIASWALVYFAETAMFLHLARFLIGLWLGAVGTIVPMYVAEITEPHVRGAFSTIFQIMANLGMLLVYLVGSKMDYYDLTYVLGALPVFLAVILFFIPESPYWYVQLGRHEDAVRALTWLRCTRPELIKEELSRIETSVTEELRRGASFKDLLSSRGNRKALLMVQVLAVAQRSSGMSALLAYASTTLPGGVGPLTPNDCVTLLGVTLTCSVFLSTFLVDRSGRRPLLSVSALGSGLAMFVAGTWFFLDEKTGYDVRGVSWTPFASFLAFCLFWGFGLGPLAATVQGEVFPANVKALASGVTAIVFALTSFSMNMVYQRIADDWGMYLNYWLFAVSSLLAALFTVSCLVETKGRTLQEIQRDLNRSP